MIRSGVAAVVCLLLWGSPVGLGQGQPTAENSDIDAFMKKVLEQRSVNWGVLQNYIFRENVVLDLKGINTPALENFNNEYLWFYRDDKLVRSLVRANGIEVSARDQARSEKKWMGKKGKGEEHLTRESFFKFKFEPGNYFFAGREAFEGREVLVIEYYPDRFFLDDEDDPDSADQEDDPDSADEEDKYEEAFKKTSLVKMWVIPELHQLVKITFENIGLEFLPYRWLVRIDDIRASMILDTPVDGVWLPREISASGAISTALNTLTIDYSRVFSNYQEAEVKVRLKFEKPPEKPARKPPGEPR